jgi:4-amino-4-deoxy-L-arabinose transferase-like glycosyltransferase
VDGITQESENSKWPMSVYDKRHVAILTAVTLILGIYFLGTTVLIAKDGILYIEIAKKIADDPLKTIRDTGQAPGYPFLIYLMHKAIGLFYGAGSLQGWIVSAQAVSLLTKLIATIALYFVGSYFVGSRFSFWGVLILSILPDSIAYGSDVLSDWPFLMFLTTGFLLLLLGFRFRKNWVFCWAGIVAGTGYLVRPECGQLMLYGGGWLLFNLIRPQGKMKRSKTMRALVLFLAGFFIIAISYMRSKGYVFPEHQMWKLPTLLSMSYDSTGLALVADISPGGLAVGKIIGSGTLITNTCETLVYYFSLPLLIGCGYYFRKQSKTLERTFFFTAFIVINVTVALWQSSYLGFLSRRHILALVSFTVFYIPTGLYIIACWLTKKKFAQTLMAEENIRRLFFVLMAAGIGICTAKLIGMTPLRWEKQGYRDVAEWLNKNTASTDIIAVPDKRIAFYAERQGIEYDGEEIPEQANYVVRIIKSGNEKSVFGKEAKEEYSTWMNRNKKNGKVATSRVIR